MKEAVCIYYFVYVLYMFSAMQLRFDLVLQRIFALQMGKVENDLGRSKQLREKQAKEFERQTEEEKKKHHAQVLSLQ